MVDEIWNRYAAGVASLAEVIDDVTIELDEVTRAEGLRHLTRVLHMGVFTTHDYADTDDPRIFLAKTPAMLSGGVTSDCIYHEGFIDPSRTYTITGTRGTAELLEISIYAGRLGRNDRSDVVDGILEDALVLDTDGRSFTITVSPEPRPAGFVGNWLCSDVAERGRADWVLIRQYSSRIDEVESAQFSITPVDGATLREPLTLDAADAMLTESLEFARRQLAHFVRSGTNIVTFLRNTFIVVDEDRDAGGALPSGHRFAAGGFDLRPDEAWVVTIEGLASAPYDAAPYWGFQLCNFWYEPLDYGATWAHRNDATAIADADGSVTFVISEQRPAAPWDRNWLPLRGHTVGSAQFRLARCDAEMPTITCEVVPVDDLG